MRAGFQEGLVWPPPCFFLPFPLQFIKASSLPAHTRESGFHISLLLANSHLSLGHLGLGGTPPWAAQPLHQIPPCDPLLITRRPLAFVLGNSLP